MNDTLKEYLQSDREMTLFHGSDKNITDGVASGTYFTTDFSLAMDYATGKHGEKVYIYAFTRNEPNIHDIFELNWEQHYIARCFIPLDYLAKMEVK